MTTNQEGLHATVRALTSTTRSYNEDWHALFDADGITAGSFNSRMLAWINATLGTSYTNVNGAMQAFAVEQGFANWASMNTFVTSLAASFLSEYGPYGMVMDFTDATIAINDATDVLDYSSQGTVSSTTGALLGPGSKLTNTAPSAKLTEQADGNIAFQAHNLYANSAAPANQTVSTGIVTGGSYALTATGAFSHIFNAVTTSLTHTGNNLVTNSTFAGGSTAGWSLTLGTSINATGDVLNVVGAGAGARATTSAITLVNGQSYRLIATMISAGGGVGLLRVGTASDGANTGTIYNTTTFSIGTIDTIITAAATTYYVSVGTPTVSVTAVWDNIYLIDTTTGERVFEFTASASSVVTSSTSGSGTAHLRRTPSVSTYVATTSAAVYDLPYVYSAGVKTGIMVEPAATNLWTYSSDQTNALWSIVGVTRAAQPAGRYPSSTLLTEDTSTGTHRIYRSFSGTGSQVYTFAWRVKRGTGSRNIFTIAQNGANLIYAWFNLSTGAVHNSGAGGTGSLTAARITAEPDGWYLLELVGSPDTASASYFNQIYLADTLSTGNTTPSYTGDGTSSLEVSIPQLETGTVATSPIITYVGTGFRAVDQLTLAGSEFPLSSSEGTLYYEGRFASVDVNANCGVTLWDGSTANRVDLRRNTFLVSSGGATQANILSAVATTTNTRRAGRYIVNSFSQAQDGAIVGTPDVGGLAPVGLTSLRLGIDTATLTYNGVIARVAWFTTAFSDANLQGVTAP